MSGSAILIALGFVTLGSYGLTLNQLEIDFSKLLGVYVGVFALLSILFGRYLFHETIPIGVWVGVGIILVGSAVIQWSGGTELGAAASLLRRASTWPVLLRAGC